MGADARHDRAMDLAEFSDRDRVRGRRKPCVARLTRAVRLEQTALADWPRADPFRGEVASSLRALKANLKDAKGGRDPYDWKAIALRRARR